MGTVLPLFPLGSPLFPGTVLPLHIFEPRYRQLVADLMSVDDPVFGVVYIREGYEVGDESARALSDIGTTAAVRAVATLPDGRFELVTVGRDRFRVLRVIRDQAPYLKAEVELLDEAEPEDVSHLAAAASAAFEEYLSSVPARLEGELPADPDALSYQLALSAVLPPADRQRVLAAQDAGQRLVLVRRLLERESAVLRNLHAVPANDFLRAGISPN